MSDPYRRSTDDRTAALILAIVAMFSVNSLRAAESAISHVDATNPDAIAEVAAGARTTANAAWWGFDPHDATEALQAAIDSGAERVVVPDMGSDWNVLPIRLRSDLELVLAPGVVIAAKRGAYRGGGDSVLTARDASNLSIRGYGATVRMHKEDYIVGTVLQQLGWHRWYGQYDKAEWRMALALRGCSSVKVLGLTLRDSGGDGIYIDGGSKQDHCRDVELRDVTCENNYRQGISVISVHGLHVEDCRFNNTWGTPPSSGVDLEPDAANQRLQNIVFRNCRFEDNYGDGIELFLAHLRNTPHEISIRFEDCYVSSRRGPGIRVTKIADDGPQGTIEFVRCTVASTQAYGVKIQDKSADRARVRFVDCQLRDVAQDPEFRAAWAPVWLHPYRVGPMEGDDPTAFRCTRFGGIDFVNCTLVDTHERPAIATDAGLRRIAVHDVNGDISVRNPHGIRTAISDDLRDSKLQLVDAYEVPEDDDVAAVDSIADSPRHVSVYREPGRFGGWPANHGIWSWGDEILVGFGRGFHKDRGDSHNIDLDRTEEHLLARSIDGGQTWTIEDPSVRGALVPGDVHLFGTRRQGLELPPATACDEPIDFAHPDFAMAIRMFADESGHSRLSYSYDRGRSWQGPFAFPLLDTPGIEARTNYLVNGKHDCTVFLSTSRMDLPHDLGTGNRPLCARTTDGGLTWKRVSWIGPPLEGNAIMPTVAPTPAGDLLCVVRRRIRGRDPQAWLAGFTSADDGETWRQIDHPVADTGVGNPASLIRLRDGRMCLTYGVRSAPYRICAKLSDDGGATWSSEIVLRDDGGNHDLGYPRTVQRTDGKVVTVYYFWDQATGPERYIAATIWDPDRTPQP